MTHPSEKDQRQLALMETRIAMYRRKGLYLGTLASDLLFLVDQLESVAQAEKDTMRTEANTLDLIYANLLERATRTPDERESRVIEESLQNLDSAIRCIRESGTPGSRV